MSQYKLSGLYDLFGLRETGNSGRKADQIQTAPEPFQWSAPKGQGDPIGKIQGCDVGTLQSLQLCSLLQFTIDKAPLPCPIQITLKQLKGLDKLKLTRLDYAVTGADALAFVLEFTVPELTGVLDTKVLSEKCSAIRSLLASGLVGALAKCADSPVTLGSSTEPIVVNLVLGISVSCKVQDDVEARVSIRLTRLTIGCTGLAGLLPSAVTDLVIERVAKLVEDLLKSIMIRKATTLYTNVAPLIPWCAQHKLAIAGSSSSSSSASSR